jgi:peptidoglycan/xylan/chitin deacetylase (PgdA/CDA1 family)
MIRHVSRRGIPNALDTPDPLERLLGLFDGAETSGGAERLDVVGGQDDRPSWLLGDEWRVFARPARELIPGGHEIAQFRSAEGEVLSASFDPARNSIQLPFSPTEAYVNYVSEAWFKRTPVRALSSAQLNAFYRVKRFIPRSLQIEGRRMLIRRQGMPDFPRWPFDPGVSRLLRFYAYCLLLARGENEADFRWFWPAPFRAAMILTHDVETAEGLPLAVKVADLEQELGYRSSFNLGGWYDADPGIVRELAGRGFEIGMHGLRHDRTLFSSREAFDSQLPGLRAMASRLGAEGFRSPSTYRVFGWLAELPISYDGSIPHSDPFEPQPGGCCSLWPFFIGDVVELPYTLPQDYTLFTLLSHRSPALWLEQTERIVREAGLIHAISHPDRGYLGDARNRDYYREFLVALSDREEIWKPLPRELAAWWRLRDSSGPDEARVARGTIRVGESPDEVELRQPVAAEKSPSDRVGQS